jgi:hypothetical protein
MKTAVDDRFASQIPWMTCLNLSGMDIPPFSCVMTVSALSIKWPWFYPDISTQLPLSAQSPYLEVTQPASPIILTGLYLTGSEKIKAGDFGLCAQPLEYPQLAALDVPTSQADAPYNPIGPVTATWTLSRGKPGFQMMATPQTINGVGYVACKIGPPSCPVVESN